jgi:hypothetical protein
VVNIATGFLVDAGHDWLVWRDRQKTVRFPSELASPRAPARRFVSRILRRNV